LRDNRQEQIKNNRNAAGLAAYPVRSRIAAARWRHGTTKPEAASESANASARSAATRRAGGGSQPLKIDAGIYQRRHMIENICAKRKEFKRIAMRADKTDQRFAAAIYLAAAVINSR
jgi:transposase